MKWCRFQAGPSISYGIVEDDNQVIEVAGSPFDTYRVTSTQYPLSDVKLLAPVIPTTFYAGGLNYRVHNQWWASYSGGKLSNRTEPGIGYRTQNAIIAPEEAIVKPKDASDEFQVEGELVVVIGKPARHVSKADALNYVLGYTIGNDVSQRTWQIEDGSLWRAKNSDTFKPMGPWIATGLDPNNLETTVRINGEVKIQFHTRDMIFDAATHIAQISRYSTLHPGDVIWLGSEGATPNMKPGDVVEIEISGIGVLRNPVLAET
jgi:2-keto-4-pentenoate hydratase/2-oxohepta-3-ene-1,7-dioic acid hydratase in catechol pathway